MRNGRPWGDVYLLNENDPFTLPLGEDLLERRCRIARDQWPYLLRGVDPLVHQCQASLVPPTVVCLRFCDDMFARGATLRSRT